MDKKLTKSQKLNKSKKLASESLDEIETPLPNAQPFHIIGIGASAGGLEALELFFKNTPVKSNMAFIVIQHLDPTRKSSMLEIMSHITDIPVHMGAENLKIESDSIYLIPPDKNMGIREGSLFLIAAEQPRGLRLPIDFFLRSLAQEKGSDAIAVILSGTGSDGTLGLRAIKVESGTVFVQDPENARYDGMPRSAINTGLVDFVLPAGQIPQKIIDFVQHYSLNHDNIATLTAGAQAPLQQIFAVMRTHTGHDFSHYKQATIRRRLQRRMSVNGFDNIVDYAHFLRDNETEVKAFLKDILISVTHFFRDPEAFAALKMQIINLLKNKPSGDDLRIWVAGCATGEEAYSVAIMAEECMLEVGKRLLFQMYATDIDANALNVARSGVYSVNIASDVTPERLKLYFIKEDKGYRIRKEIRENIVFAPQDFTKDPPFSKIDIICCRNLLIYLETAAQKKLYPVLHYALKPGGLLFLGTSESIGDASELFNVLDKKWRIYQRREVIVSPVRLKLPVYFAHALSEPIEPIGTSTEAKLPELTEKIFLDHYAPTFVVIDEKFRLVYVRGRTGKYLEIPSGRANLSVLELAREGLRTELAAALYRAANEKKLIIKKAVRIKHNGGFQSVNLTIIPLVEHGMPQGLMMVVFQEVEEDIDTAKARSESKRGKGTARLEEELKLTKENLQSTIEELEATNEEIKSANEELQSNNEELQSSNEELDTSREELQSLNEELLTVNSELSAKSDLLTKANDDLKNYLNRTEIAIIFLDNDLKIRSFTPPATEVFNIREINIGRPLDEITSRLAFESLADTTREVLRTLGPKEIEVQRKDGHWYNMRILPYLTVQNALGGLVVSFLDIDKQKLAAAAERRLATVVKDSNDAIVTNDLEGKIQTWNKGAARMFGYSEEEALRLNMADLVIKGETTQEGKFLADLKNGKEIESLEVQRRTKDGRTIDVWLTATKVIDDHGKIVGVATTERDITERKAAEERVNSLNRSLLHQTEELRAANKELDGYSFTISNNLKAPLRHMDGFSRALLEECYENLNEAGKGYLQRISEASKLMSHFMEKLTELSSIAIADLNYTDINLSEMVQNSELKFKLIYPQRKVDFVIQPEMKAYGDLILLQAAVD
jgi:two-component system, chemotaxis family, CheB/CheR fusion protein